MTVLTCLAGIMLARLKAPYPTLWTTCCVHAHACFMSRCFGCRVVHSVIEALVRKGPTTGWADLWSDLIDFCSTQLCLRISVRLSFPSLETQGILLQCILHTDSVTLSHPASSAGEGSGCRRSEVNLAPWVANLPTGSDVTDCSFTTNRHTYSISFMYIHRNPLSPCTSSWPSWCQVGEGKKALYQDQL